MAVFGVGVLAAFGLLLPALKSSTDTADHQAAVNVAGLLKGELRTRGFDATAALLIAPELLASFDANEDPRVLFASRTGTLIGTRGSAAWDGADREKFFEIVLVRNPELSPAADDATAGFLAYMIKVSWPAFEPSGIRFRGEKHSLYFNGALVR